MAKFIKLTMANDKSWPVYVNFDRVVRFGPTLAKDSTYIVSRESREDGREVFVKESPEQILALISGVEADVRNPKGGE